MQWVAKQFGYGVVFVRSWVCERDVVDGVSGLDAQRLREPDETSCALEQELRETRRANEILTKAAVYFAQAELDRTSK